MSSEEGTEPHKALPLDMFLRAGCEEKTAMGRKTGRAMRREERDEGGSTGGPVCPRLLSVGFVSEKDDNKHSVKLF